MTMQKPIIYQMLPRLWGNDKIEPKKNGSLSENGTGKFVFTNDLKLTWQDDQEDAAKDLVFTYAN